jgi:hypothetical protein
MGVGGVLARSSITDTQNWSETFVTSAGTLAYFQVSTILQQRSTELCEPQLEVSIFNLERNQLAKERMEARVSCTAVLLIECIYHTPLMQLIKI